MSLEARPEASKRRASALSPVQMWRLDAECQQIRAAFGATPYLVGSVLTRADWRDVDVRLVLPDEEFAQLDNCGSGSELRIFLGLALSEWLSGRTGLPIDFQIQQMTGANLHHPGRRNALGVRTLQNFTGDWDTATVQPVEPSGDGS